MCTRNHAEVYLSALLSNVIRYSRLCSDVKLSRATNLYGSNPISSLFSPPNSMIRAYNSNFFIKREDFLCTLLALYFYPHPADNVAIIYYGSLIPRLHPPFLTREWGLG